MIIDFLEGTARASVECPGIIREAEKSRTEIVVSALAMAETAKLAPAMPPDEAERKIAEFFSRRYVVVANVDQAVCEIARRLVRTYPLKPLDAVHMATAIYHQIPRLETYDPDLLRLNGKERLRDSPNDPPLEILHPEGAPELPLFSGLLN